MGATVLLVAGIGVWWYYHNQPAAAPGTAPASPGSSPTPAPGSAPISAPPPAPLSVSPVTSIAAVNTPATVPSPVPSVAGNAAVPYDPRMDQVQSWANSALTPANLAQYNAQKGNFTQADWNGLYDLIINRFMGGQPNTPARTAFWDSWRTTYHIDDGTYT